MTFTKGQVLTHKRTGRPKGFRGMAKDIQRRTQNGKTLVDFAMEVFENLDDKYFHHQRWEALVWLSDRGFGRPVQTLELDAAIMAQVDAPKPKIDVAGLDGSQRAALRTALAILHGERRPPAAAAIDASAVEVAETEH